MSKRGNNTDAAAYRNHRASPRPPRRGKFFRAAAIFAQNVFAIFPASPDNFGRRAAARSPATWPNRFLTTKFLFL